MAYDPNTIKERIKLYVIQASHAEESKINNESLILKEGYFDSMGLIMLLAFIEEQFGIKTSWEDLKEENFKSINAITDFIRLKTNHAS